MRRIFDEKPDLDALAHYGVKGMKWGIVNDDDGGGSSGGKSESKSSSTKAAPKKEPTSKWAAAHQPKKEPTKKQAAKNLEVNEKKFDQKFESSDKPNASAKKESFVSKHKSELIKIGVGAAIVGGLVGASVLADKQMREKIAQKAGKQIGAKEFTEHVNFSKRKTWMKNDFIQPQSFERKPITLPAGHEFHRISKYPETAFEKKFSYSTHNIADYDRYIAAFRQEKGVGVDLHHITWKANEEVRIPDLHTTLDILKESMIRKTGPNHIGPPPRIPSDKEVLDVYQRISGGDWRDEHSEKFISTLLKKGYHGIVDEMDAGVIGETPLVIFGHDAMGKKSSSPITKELIEESEGKLIEILNRKT